MVRNGFPNNKRSCNRIRKRVCQVMAVRVYLVHQGLEIFSKLSEPNELPRKHVGADSEVMAMLGNMSEIVSMQQRRGIPKVFGDGLGRAADL